VLAQVLNRDFVLGVAGSTERRIESHIAERAAGLRAPDALREVPTEELRETSARLAAARASAEAEAALGGEADAPRKEDYAWIPRDALLSLLQSALESHARATLPTEEVRMDDDGREGEVPAVTDELIAGVELRHTQAQRRIWGPMEVAHPGFLSDPRWILAVVQVVKRAFTGRARFVAKPTLCPPLADNARVVLVGDWGSGIPRARKVSAQIKGRLSEPEARGRQLHVVHLGDVYYAGAEDEYRDHLLGPWPVGLDANGVASYTLSGNHDMYSGGFAYYATLADTRFAAQGGSSMFCLANEHWQLLGLDTGYEDGGLQGGQARWVAGMRSGNPGRKTMLLTHHQPFSAYGSGAAKLRQKIAPVLRQGPVEAWFWGHEHRCLAYRDREGVAFGSCIGHGGLPEYLHPGPAPAGSGLVYEYRKPYGTGWQKWITFGFVVLDFAGPSVHARYVDEDGAEHWSCDL
jgi:hypothetical protein